MSLMLAQSGGSATVSVLAWAGALIAVLIIAGAVLMLLHKKLLGRGDEGHEQEGLMDSLRRLRDSGQMSKDEFEAAKHAIVRKSVEQMEARRAARESKATGPQDQASGATPDNDDPDE